MIPPDDVRRFFAEYFGMEPDAIPMGMRTMLDEIMDAVAEMNRGIRGYLPAGPEVRGLLEGGDGGVMGLLGWDAPTEQEQVAPEPTSDPATGPTAEAAQPEAAAQPEPEQKPSAKTKAFKRVREPVGEHGAYMEGIKENGHWVGEVKYFPAANDKLPEMIQHYDGLGRLERIQTMYSTDRSKVYTETFYYADGTSLQTMFAPNGDRVRSVSIDVNGRETILYSRQLERFRQNLEEAKGSKHFPKEAIDWELLTSDNKGLRIAEGVLFYVKDLDRQDAEPNLDKKQRESKRRRSQDKLREYRKEALALQEELQKRRGHGGNVALSIGGRTTGAEFNDVRPAEVGRQRRAGAYYPDIGQWLANTAFSIGERRKAEYRAVIGKKRPDLPADEVERFMVELDKLGDTKREKTALHWFVKGGLQLPQEAETLKKALEVSAAFGIDPFRTGTPQEVLRMASQMAQARSKELQGPFLGPEDIGLTHLPPDTPVHVEGNENDTSMTVGDEQNGIYEFYSDNELTDRALYKDGKRVKDLPLDGDIAPFNTALSLGDGFKRRLDGVNAALFGKLEPLTRGEDAHLHREGFGDVRYPFSDSDKRGREAATGFVHIVRQRLRKDVDDLDDAVAIAVLVADAVENGEKKSGRSSNTTYFDKDGVRAVVGTHEDGEKVVTGFQIWESEEEKANANFRSATRASVPHGSSEEMVASLATIIANRLGNGSANTSFSVGSRPGRAPVVEPGGDVREAGEGALAWLRRKFVHSQTPVFDAVRRVMGKNATPPDALNVEAAAKNVHGKIRARQEMLQRAYLEPLKAILAQPGMDRKRFDDYALALHALERNRMIQERSVVVDPTTGEVVDLGVEAGSGVTNAWAERVIREIQRDPFAAQYKEAAQLLAEMNRFVLRGAVADGLLTEAQAATWMRLSPHYVPLKSGGAAPGAIHKRATGRFTRPDSVLVNSMRQAYATVRNGELNRVNKTMADWIRQYDPNGEQVGGTVPESHKHAKIKMADPQYVPKGSSAEALLRERGIRLVETEDKGGYWVDTGVLPNALKRVVRESVPQGDDIVTFWENGERKFIRFEGKRGRDGRAENEAARIADALNFKNVLHKEGRFWDAIRGLTRWKANVSTSWNPTFIVRNMGADVFNTANLMMIEGKYAELARTMRNYPEALNRVERSSHAWVSFTDGAFLLAEVA